MKKNLGTIEEMNSIVDNLHSNDFSPEYLIQLLDTSRPYVSNRGKTKTNAHVLLLAYLTSLFLPVEHMFHYFNRKSPKYHIVDLDYMDPSMRNGSYV